MYTRRIGTEAGDHIKTRKSRSLATSYFAIETYITPLWPEKNSQTLPLSFPRYVPIHYSYNWLSWRDSLCSSTVTYDGRWRDCLLISFFPIYLTLIFKSNNLTRRALHTYVPRRKKKEPKLSLLLTRSLLLVPREVTLDNLTSERLYHLEMT